ncbi:MAG: sigma-70 family RNA polymerase sigma factor [Thermogemmatispora sp.]|jgi:RNA polymerase sigma factor (sigma-70 family)|uniref:RNA polymerase sigma factor n=1 Tax=Thermogemmatispora TaxID=768669 RepID=UPI00124F0AE6|nr:MULTISPECIES: sigma-70 family RNA polymerase sigma factor [Thermogemmatispora]MBE3567590.1 sigma-70 family RNA polymerase sigma factor [Thermogemmatispora sp.]
MKREPERSRFSPVPSASSAEETARAELERALIEHSELLLQNLQFYVVRLGAAPEREAHAIALEVLQEVAVEALAHAARFEPGRQPLAWLLGIGLNVIRRQKAERARRNQRELSPARLASALAVDQSPSELEAFDHLQATSAGPEEEVEAEQGAAALLALVGEEDRELLRLAVIEGCERELLARHLGISPVAARVRLHRALQRLRRALQQQVATNLDRPG